MNVFSLATLISNFFIASSTFIFEPTATYYYFYVAINVACMLLWLFRGQRVEDFLALSILFITIYVLLPAPLNAASYFVFWGSPGIYGQLSTDVPYLCAVFLAAASAPTLLGVVTPRGISASEYNLNWRAVIVCIALMSAYLVLNYSLFFSKRIDIELGAADAGWRPLTGILLIILPRALASAVFLCLVIFVVRRLKEKFPLIEGLVLFSLLSICLLYFNPLSIPRQLTMAFGLSAFYLLSWFGILNHKWFALLILVAAFLVGPAISNITRFETTTDYFPVSADFDCFQNMNLAIDIVKVDGFKFGGHILASLSSILPSELKFFNDYHLLASPYFVDLLFASNISMPLPAELYVDFGTFGLLAQTMLIFWYLRFVYSQVAKSETSASRIYHVGKVCILFGCWPALMRGPILGNSPVLITFLLSWFLAYKLLHSRWPRELQRSKAVGSLRSRPLISPHRPR